MVFADLIRARGFEHSVSIQPSGSDVTLTTPCHVIWVGGSGTVKVDTVGGEIGVTFTVQAGVQILPVQAKKVYSSGTSATGLIALYSAVGS